MAKTIPADEQVFMVSKSTNTTYSGSAALKAMNEWYTMEDVANTVQPYKVFTALLTQGGGDNPDSKTDGLTTIGVSYTIANYLEGDFTIIGAPNNLVGTSFIATGTTPNWGSTEGSQLNYNTGAPVVDILENTIGNVWFEFGGADGVYQMRSDGLFSSYKTVGFITYNDGGSTGLNDKPSFSIYPSNDGNIYVNSALNGITSSDVLFYAPFEIKVYN
jgi:hypothetical protein